DREASDRNVDSRRPELLEEIDVGAATGCRVDDAIRACGSDLADNRRPIRLLQWLIFFADNRPAHIFDRLLCGLDHPAPECIVAPHCEPSFDVFVVGHELYERGHNLLRDPGVDEEGLPASPTLIKRGVDEWDLRPLRDRRTSIASGTRYHGEDSVRFILADPRVECLDRASWPALVIQWNDLYRSPENAALRVQLIGRELGRLHNRRRDNAIDPAEADGYGDDDRLLLLRRRRRGHQHHKRSHQQRFEPINLRH